MKQKRVFTATWLERLKPEDIRKDYRDAGRRGLHLRVWPASETRPNGTKVFVYCYQRDNKASVLKLGHYPDISLAQAHDKYDEARKLLAKGQDPQQVFAAAKEAESSAGTVADLIGEWITRYAEKNRKHEGKPERALLAHNLPTRFLKLKAKDITRRQVITLLDEVADRSGSVANDLCSLLKQVFAFGVQRDFIPSSPLVGLPKPGGKETPRDRSLTDGEIKVFWNTLSKCEMSERVRLALRFLLLTAQRRGETSRAKWSDIDFDNATWTIPAEDAKTGQAHVVPLAPLAIDILMQLRAISEDEERESVYVFPSPHSNLKAAEPMTERAFTRAVRENEDRFALPHFTPHDFRRTARTGMARLGVADTVAERVLNHKLQGMMAVYNRHSYLDEKRAALTQWADHIHEVVA